MCLVIHIVVFFVVADIGDTVKDETLPLEVLIRSKMR